MVIWCTFFMRVLMFDLKFFELESLLIECLYIAILSHDVIVMRGLVFHSLLCIVLINGSYLVYLCVTV